MSGADNRPTAREIGDTMLDYDEAKKLAKAESAVDRRALAARPDAQPEFLYFLAEDSVPGSPEWLGPS